MNNVYITINGMTKEQMFRLHLMNGFNFVPITTDVNIAWKRFIT